MAVLVAREADVVIEEIVSIAFSHLNGANYVEFQKDWLVVAGEAVLDLRPTASEYTKAGLPWFEYYGKTQSVLPRGEKPENFKSMSSIFKKMTGSQLLRPGDITISKPKEVGAGAKCRRLVQTTNSWERRFLQTEQDDQFLAGLHPKTEHVCLSPGVLADGDLLAPDPGLVSVRCVDCALLGKGDRHEHQIHDHAAQHALCCCATRRSLP